ncbi:hypothetical protein B296_00004513 [Ensete ventricosum]|uniref:Uncharacterized protein n=1 Tax=Ensete ventricosum TaxID=4639 RepID=A0A426XPJ6_ENSVE|nr:hypothetical protein B296_00004513 [Ensete ventricosum]
MADCRVGGKLHVSMVVGEVVKMKSPMALAEVDRSHEVLLAELGSAKEGTGAGGEVEGREGKHDKMQSSWVSASTEEEKFVEFQVRKSTRPTAMVVGGETLIRQQKKNIIFLKERTWL